MPRGRRSSSASSDGNLSRSRSRPATFRQRSQSRPGSPRPTRSKSRGPSPRSARSKSRGPSPRSSRSKSRGPPPSRRLSSPSTSHDDPNAKKDPQTSGPGVKGSLLFLGTIAAAAFTAHKVWPKGVLYGHKEDWEAEHGEAAVPKKSRKAHREHEKQGGRDAPVREERGRAAPPRYRDADQDDRRGYVTSKSPRDAPPSAWAEDRPRVFESAAPASGRFTTTKTTTAPFTSIPFDSDRHTQSTGSGSGTSPRKYLPYEPGVYTPSSVASSRQFERERPIPLPLERQRGGYLPSIPVAPARRFYEDEGYGSGEPVTRSSRYQDLDEVDYRR